MQMLMPEALNLPGAGVVGISCCYSHDIGVKNQPKSSANQYMILPIMLFLQPRQVQSQVDPVPV